MLTLRKNKKTMLLAFVVLGLIVPVSVFVVNKNMAIGDTYADAEEAYTMPEGFNDQVFYNCVVNRFKVEFEDEEIPATGLTDGQLAKITRLGCDGWNTDKITGTAGIEKMIGLVSLDLSYNNIESINLTNNTLLETLDLDDNDIEELDVSNHPSLKTVRVSYNDLVSVSVANDNMLTSLYAYSARSRLSSVDVSGCSNLETLNISSLNKNNSMTELDLSDNVELVTLSVYGNNLSDKNIVINNTKLQNLYLGDDDPRGGDFLYNNFSEIDLSNNTELKKANLTSNKLRSIDVRNLINLEELGLAGNLLEELDVRNNTRLTKLTIGRRYTCTNTHDLSELHACSRSVGNSISELNLLNNTQLTSLSVANNEFGALDLSNQTNLVYLDASSNHLNENTLRLPEDDNIKTLWLENNNFSDFSFSMEHLRNLDLSGNDFVSYKIKNLPSLDALYIGNDGLVELDIADAASLKGLEARGTSLESIDVSGNPELQDLRIDNIFVDVDAGYELKNGNVEYDFSNLKFVGACNVIDNSDIYTYDASSKSLFVNNIMDFPGYVQTVEVECVEYPNNWWMISSWSQLAYNKVGGQDYKIRLTDAQKIDEDDAVVPNTAAPDTAAPDTGANGLKESNGGLDVFSGWILLFVAPVAGMIIAVRQRRKKRCEIEVL